MVVTAFRRNRVDVVGPAKPPIGERARGFARRNSRRFMAGVPAAYYAVLAGVATYDYTSDWKLDGDYGALALTPAALILAGGLAYKAGKRFFNFTFDAPSD